jgi:transposase-like protein
MNSQSLTLLKRDERGRVRSTPQMRQAAVAEYQRSGLTACSFAKMAGISKNTFWNWLQAHGLTRQRPRVMTMEESKPVRFVQVTPSPMEPTGMSLRVRLPGGAVLEMAEASQVPLVARLIEALHHPSASC